MTAVNAAWVALSLVRGVGGVTMRALLAEFDTPAAVVRASEHDLCQVRGVGEKTAQAIRSLDLSHITRSLDRWQRAGVKVLTMNDPDYPTALHDLPDCPPSLFVLGTLRATHMPHIAVVGTRQPAPLARSTAAVLGEGLTSAGAVVVSGMAAGVDGIAQRAALSVSGSTSIGVLGSGVLNPYPPTNAALAHMLQQYGTLISEVAPDATVSAAGLVARNRIISGLSAAVVVVETDVSGGAMYAARAARRQGRRLYALDIHASGNRQLIDSGQAQPLTPGRFTPASLI